MDIFRRRGSIRLSGRRPGPSSSPRPAPQAADFRPKIREVHRCGWLSVSQNADHQEKGAFAMPTCSPERTREKRWVVFCIHDDEYPYVELYLDEKKAVNHKPESYLLLRPCFHVSPCLMPLDHGELRYYFVIALPNEVMELCARDRMAMMEWVDCFRRKLQELKILAPRNNIYSSEPIPRALLPTSRNPLSPLPPCPFGNAEIPAGVEIRLSEEGRSVRRPAPPTPREQTTPVAENEVDVEEDVYVPVWGASSAATASSSPSSVRSMETQHGAAVSNETASSFDSYANTAVLNRNRAATDVPSSSSHPTPVEEFTYESTFDVPSSSRARHASESSASTSGGSTYETTFDTTRQLTRRRSSGTASIAGGASAGATPSALPSRSIVHRPLPPPPVPPPRMQKTMKEEQVEDFRRQQQAKNLKARVPYQDCVGTLALIDCGGAVWIAGWKQKEHPRLNYYFHIGDQLRMINGMRVTSSSQAQKLVKDTPMPEVEMLFRRVPLGKIVLIKRSSPGESLGIVRLGNTAVIREVIEDGLAHASGLPLRAPTLDGFSLTTWTLTEVNGRSLNLFFKGSEVADRLNAVGQEISLLVQPQDLVDGIKRQLKQMRSYKDYIVQYPSAREIFNMKYEGLYSAGFNGFCQIKQALDDLERFIAPSRVDSFHYENVFFDDVAITKSAIFIIKLAGLQLVRKGSCRPSEINPPRCVLPRAFANDECLAAGHEWGDSSANMTEQPSVHVWLTVSTDTSYEWKKGARLPSSDFANNDLNFACNDHHMVVAWNESHVSVIPNPPVVLPTGIRIKTVGVGMEHVAVLTEDGRVFTWGTGARGALGHGDLLSLEEPREIESLSGMRIAELACGGWHNVAATEDGDVCVWGWNESGQLGLPARGHMDDHRLVCRLKESCRSNHRRPTAAGDVDGPGMDSVAVAAEPKFLDCFPDDMRVEELACGDRHSVLLTNEQKIYVWGHNEYGQLGLGDCCPRDRPEIVQPPVPQRGDTPAEEPKRLSIRAGGWNTCILVNSNLGPYLADIPIESFRAPPSSP